MLAEFNNNTDPDKYLDMEIIQGSLELPSKEKLLD